MNLPKSFNTFTSIIWYGEKENNSTVLIDTLISDGYQVEQISNEDELKSRFQEAPSTFLILDQPGDISRCIQLVISFKLQAKESALTSVLISDKASIEDKEKYYQAGGNEIIHPPVSHKELLSKIKHYKTYHKDSSDFSTQLEEASQMALLAMENSSDLGGILNFVKSAMNSKTYEDLAEQIFQSTDLYCDTAIVEIKGHENFYYYSSCDPLDPDMKRFLLAQKSSDRVVKSETSIQINNQNLVVLLDGLPIDDPEKMGRISDTLVMLCDTANRFAQSIATEENLGKAEESRRRFLTTLSHELRTPLNGIFGFSKALKKKDEETPLGKSGIDALSRIFESTSQINAIITTLIDISSASLGAQGMISKNFDISSLALKLETNFRQAALEKGLDFSIDYPDGLTMLSDEKKIYSMLQHLVDNAIKFTQSGSVNIRLNTDFNPTSGQRIIFEVSDTGIGIDPRDHKRIFTEVGQLNNEHNREHYGVGLGLYYVNLLSQQIGGRVEVESTPGEGAKFTLDLPAGELILEAEPVNEEQEIDDLLF